METVDQFTWGRPMVTAPEREGATAWLYCVDPPGWHSGVRRGGRWYDSVTESRELFPVRWEASYPKPKLKPGPSP